MPTPLGLVRLIPSLRPHSFPPDWIPTGIDEYNKKIIVASIKDPDLFRVKK
jgi:hypothetical protein